MDGSTTSFPFDATCFSSVATGDPGGILYVEDFDLHATVNSVDDLSQANVEAPPLLLTIGDLEAAREAGRTEGTQVALADALLIQSQLNGAAIQSLSDTLRTEYLALEAVANRHASQCVRTTLAVLQAAVPAIMTRHAVDETEAIIGALVSSFTYDPELRVRVNPGLADKLRETLVECLRGKTIMLSVVADADLIPGDVHVMWKDGQAKRDCIDIWNTIRTALKLLDLPTIDEVCHAG